MRITTNAILRNYKSNLSTSMENLDSARNKVMTQRQFGSVSEDPASALRASILERRYARNEDYLNTVQDAQSFQDAQEDGAMQINSVALTLSKDYGIEALNATNADQTTRETYAAAWRSAQESLVSILNSTYEGKFVFAGSDGLNVPFELVTNDDGTQTLTYRGVDVNSNDPLLDEYADEKLYVDLGFGLDVSETNSTISIESTSAFNTSLPGITLVGYGQDDNGNSKNMVLLAGQIAAELEKEDFDYDKYKELLTAFDETRDGVLEKVTTLGTQTEFLTNTKERLESSKISLATQYDNIVNVDMAEAITDYSYAYYIYNAALKVGNSILSQTFIDYMS